MRTMVKFGAVVLVPISLLPAFALRLPSAKAQGKAASGWLTDAACARGRANGGKFTGGNPDCAKRCVSEGSKIALALPDEKKLLVVTNPETARGNVGNFVEVNGIMDAESGTIEIRSVKLLEEGRAICAYPRKKN